MTRVLNSHEYVLLRRELIAAREAAGLTQVELAAKLARTQSFVSKYEKGERRLDVIDFLMVCRGLDVEPSELIRLVDHKKG
ncbi:transcriptional regulator [Pseudoxanthomonas yeongjuensis]|uniref:helix-turn-helix domain-containing protein n=1 Tax=Pseudoxanthomonas yeongjuensis TaxID=377616 RepID=UPI0013908083|nr:helix-turn-helix transcriptional regulator [Pseudoxanthomonas yeongjuensis]KAF1718015.1 transcriptional regulator [Pseudoxanthomonas yeongjuensis]